MGKTSQKARIYKLILILRKIFLPLCPSLVQSLSSPENDLQIKAAAKGSAARIQRSVCLVGQPDRQLQMARQNVTQLDYF